MKLVVLEDLATPYSQQNLARLGIDEYLLNPVTRYNILALLAKLIGIEQKAGPDSKQETLLLFATSPCKNGRDRMLPVETTASIR